MPDRRPGRRRRSARGPARRARAGTHWRGFGKIGPDPFALPLIAWGEARTLAAAQRRRRRLIAGAAALGLALLALATLVPAPLLVWNASASMPPGLYRVSPGPAVAAGDTVVVRLPQPARALAARRRYLPQAVPAVKRVAATAGARICAHGEAISIEGKRVAVRLAADRRGRPLPWWTGCRTLAADDVFLLVPKSRDSFDGRYFGPSARGDIIGRARLLWAARPAGGKRD